jgi:hypothetical protein
MQTMYINPAIKFNVLKIYHCGEKEFILETEGKY